MRALDASAIIHGWNHYPPEQFPRLWLWLSVQVAQGELAIPAVALDEVAKREPTCAKWLKEHGVQVLDLSDAILREAQQIKGLLGVQGEKYYGTGVSENDLIIVATARSHGIALISNEQRQPTLPPDTRKYKIPTVCGLAQVQVECLSFLDFIKQLRQVFG